MGACCTKDRFYGGRRYTQENDEDVREWNDNFHEQDVIQVSKEDGGGLIRLHGPSTFTSMFTKKGKKGINQDAMTIWEDFTGNKGMTFCGVFDGHGPSGHIVSQQIRNSLPSKLSEAIRMSGIGRGGSESCKDNNMDNKEFLSLWEANFVRSFEEMDEELRHDSSIDSYCSGTTAVTAVKQGEHLIIANLGDSRAVLCTRGDRNQLLPVQLTVDLKPDVAYEAERIKCCQGRILADTEEPDVYRIWMPEEDYPGLAMARAFGDFCLKDHGLIATPQVSYKRITSKDEFVVLATDGVWDVLTNAEVIKTVACAEKQSMAAKLVAMRAVNTWKRKYPGSTIDDCAVICLFLKGQTNPTSGNLLRAVSQRFGCNRNEGKDCTYYSKVEGNNSNNNVSPERIGRVDTITMFKLPRFLRVFSNQRTLQNFDKRDNH